jgi:hypothetical protein
MGQFNEQRRRAAVLYMEGFHAGLNNDMPERKGVAYDEGFSDGELLASEHKMASDGRAGDWDFSAYEHRLHAIESGDYLGRI